MQSGLGQCYLFLGRLDQAIELFDQVRAARPRFWDVHMWLAGAFALQGDLDAARAELGEAGKLKPEVTSLARWRAYQPWIALFLSIGHCARRRWTSVYAAPASPRNDRKRLGLRGLSIGGSVAGLADPKFTQSGPRPKSSAS
jgi:tetratricopeptide (TPR) repeat protein